jgi:histidine triad (HIT) family protein
MVKYDSIAKDNKCIFCKIINKEANAEIVFEDQISVAFAPLKPVAEGHLLLVPKTHFENILDIDDKILKEIVITSKKISSDTMKENKATGVNILHASGKDAQQSVLHFHLHIVPRRPDDGLDLWLKNKL